MQLLKTLIEKKDISYGVFFPPICVYMHVYECHLLHTGQGSWSKCQQKTFERLPIGKLTDGDTPR